MRRTGDGINDVRVQITDSRLSLFDDSPTESCLVEGEASHGNSDCFDALGALELANDPAAAVSACRRRLSAGTLTAPENLFNNASLLRAPESEAYHSFGGPESGRDPSGSHRHQFCPDPAALVGNKPRVPWMSEIDVSTDKGGSPVSTPVESPPVFSASKVDPPTGSLPVFSEFDSSRLKSLSDLRSGSPRREERRREKRVSFVDELDSAAKEDKVREGAKMHEVENLEVDVDSMTKVRPESPRASPPPRALSSDTSDARAQFPCTECGETFQTRQLLVAHTRVHSDEVPFSCPNCDRKFRWRTSMIFHCSTVHQGDAK